MLNRAAELELARGDGETFATPYAALREDAAGVACIVASAVPLLLYDQLGFIEKVQRLHAGGGIRLILAVMGVAGLLTSVAAPALLRTRRPIGPLRAGFALSGAAVALSIAADALAPLLLASAGMGASVSVIGVSLIAASRPALRARRIGARVGAGIGLSYAIASVPWLFLAAPEIKGLAALAACACGAAATFAMSDAAPCADPRPPARDAPRRAPGSFLSTVLLFFALVWLDSAAFAVILGNPALKAMSWGTEPIQWRNSALHLASALLGGWLVDRGRLHSTLALSYAAIALGIHLLQGSAPAAPFASGLYVLAASLYSVALFAYAPECLDAAGKPRIRGRWGAFALALWAGSTLGIGMAQPLASVPGWFTLAAGLLVGVALLQRARGGRGAAGAPAG